MIEVIMVDITLTGIVLLACSFQYAYSINSYLVTFPKVVEEDLTLPIDVEILKADGPVTITATLTDESNTDISTATGTGNIVQGSVQGRQNIQLNIRFPTDEVESHTRKHYQLRVSGRGGLVFQSYTRISLTSDAPTLKIVTNKEKYHPGEEVHFLVYGLHTDTTPIRSSYDVIVKDTEGNRIAQFLGVSDKNGLFSGRFKIPRYAEKGEWKIIVIQEGKHESKDIEVDNYELPTFIVHLDAPSYVPASVNSINITTTVRYPNGKPVSGKVILGVTHNHRKMYKESKFNGKYTFTLRQPELLRFSGQRTLSYVNLKFNVKVIEDVSGKLISKETRTFFQGPYNDVILTLDPSRPRIFKPDIPFKTWVKVLYNGKPLNNPRSRLNVTLTARFASDGDMETVSSILYEAPKDGILHLTFDTPTNATGIQYSVTYEKSIVSHYVERAVSPTGHYIKIQRDPSISKDVVPPTINITATEPIDKLHFILTDGKKVINKSAVDMLGQSTGTLHLPRLDKTQFSVLLLVYYLRKDGELISDASEIANNKDFEEISITSVNKTLTPDSMVDLSMDPGSAYFVLVKGNDERLNIRNDRGLLPSNDDEIALNQLSPETAMKAFENVGLFYLSDVCESTSYNANATCQTSHRDRHVSIHATAGLRGTSGSPSQSIQSYDPSSSIFMESPRRMVDKDSFIWKKETPVNSEPNGLWEIKLKAPQSVTSMDVTLMGLKKYGGEISSQKPLTLNVDLLFHLRLDLPYSIKSGNLYIMEVVVFNNLNYDVEALITLQKNDNWYNLIASLVNGKTVTRRESSKVAQLVKISSGYSSLVLFPIEPKHTGKFDVILTATTQTNISDAIQRSLNVEMPVMKPPLKKPTLINIPAGETKKFSFYDLSIQDQNLTNRVEVIVRGDIIGPSVDILAGSVNRISRIRYGFVDAETLLDTLAPNILLTKYYKSMGQVENKPENYEEDYTKLMQRQLADGSFSSFGTNDIRGSTWFTATVLNLIQNIADLVKTNDTAGTRAAQWLASQQNSDGSFQENGRVVANNLKGGSSKGAAELTAYVLSSLIGVSCQGCVDSAIRKATLFLEGQAAVPNTPFSLAIIGNALELAKSSKVNQIMSQLNRQAKDKDGLTFWENDGIKESKWYPKRTEIDPQDMETSIYVASILLHKGALEDIFPILRWIVSKHQTPSSPEMKKMTIEAVTQLLSLYVGIAERIRTSQMNLKMQVTAQTKPVPYRESFVITRDNVLLLHSLQLPKDPQLQPVRVDVEYTGPGIALFEVHRFMTENHMYDPISLDVHLINENNKGYTVVVCTRNHDSFAFAFGNGDIGMHTPKRISMSDANMLLTFDIPDGAMPDINTLQANLKHDALLRYEQGDKRLTIYLQQNTSDESCINVPFLTNPNGRRHPARVVARDIDDDKKVVTKYFESAFNTYQRNLQCEQRCGSDCQC